MRLESFQNVPDNFDARNSRLIATEVRVLNELCQGDDSEVLSWITNCEHGHMLRNVVEQYLRQHQDDEVNIIELAELVRAQDLETETPPK
jgi:hypothetical protein